MNDKEIKSLVYDHLTSVAPEAARLYKMVAKADQLSSQMPKLEHILSSPLVKHFSFGFSFPDCVVAEIFSNLNLKQRIAVQRVCKQWHSLATANVDSVVFYGSDKKGSHWRNQMKAYNIVEKTAICVRNWREVYWVMKKCKQLKHVKFCECNLRMNDYFPKVWDLFADVESIRIHYSYDYVRLNSFKIDLTEENIRQMLKHCKNLKELAVQCYLLNLRTRIPRRKKSLVTIPLSVEFLESILLQHQHLNSLCLQSIPNLENCGFLLPALKKLDLFYYEGDRNKLLYFLQNVVKRSEESLEILYTPAVREEHLRIISRFKNLKDLRIADIQDDTWSEYFPFQNLEILKVRILCEQFGAEQLVNVIRRNRKLRVLDLYESRYSHSINDWVIEQIVEHCNHLQTLILGSAVMTDNMLLNLLQLSKLEMLLSNKSGFTLNALNTLIINHSSLRVVSCLMDNEVLQNVVEEKQLMPNYSKNKTYFFSIEDEKIILETLPKNIYINDSKYGLEFRFYFEYMSQNTSFIDYFDWKKIPILNRKPK